MKCMYCREEVFDTPMYVIKEAVKPKGSPYRWRKLGHCCQDCYSKDKPISIETIK